MESIKETLSEARDSSPSSGFSDEWLWTGLWQLSYENCFGAWDNN